jgi:hypothetical protein
MKMCPEHWAALKKAIQDRALWPLVNQSGEAAKEEITRELDGANDDAKGFDPLLRANWMIFNRALESGGLYLMTAKPDGSEHCPLCEAEKALGAGEAQRWIDGCTDSLRLYAREIKLIPGVQ